MGYSNYWQIFWQNGFLMTQSMEGESEIAAYLLV